MIGLNKISEGTGRRARLPSTAPTRMQEKQGNVFAQGAGKPRFRRETFGEGRRNVREELRVFVGFDDYKPWGGAVRYYDAIYNAGKLDEFEEYLEELYPDGIGKTELNDFLWFDGDSVLSDLGIEAEEIEEGKGKAPIAGIAGNRAKAFRKGEANPERPWPTGKTAGNSYADGKNDGMGKRVGMKPTMAEPDETDLKGMDELDDDISSFKVQ